MGLGFCLLAQTLALAGGPEDWSSAYDARLSQAMGAAPSEAIAVYEALVSQIEPEDDQRGDVLYWLGRARWSAGDLAGARRSLESAGKYRGARSRVRILLARMDAEAKSVRRVPMLEEFRQSTDPWVRGWKRGRATDLSIEDGPGGRSVRWATEVAEGDSDFVLFGLDTDGERVSSISFRLRSESLQGRYRFLLEDQAGRRWTVPVQSVPTDRWVDVSLSVKGFVPVDTGATRNAPNGRALKWFTLRDVTSLHTDQRGTNALLIDDLMVR